MIYLDTSALLKLVIPEEHSKAISEYVDGRTDFVSSVVLAVEARRGALRKARHGRCRALTSSSPESRCSV